MGIKSAAFCALLGYVVAIFFARSPTGFTTGSLARSLPTNNDGINDFNPPRGSFVNLTHGQTHYVFVGPQEGETVVLVHGFISDNRHWDTVADDLVAKNRRVLYYDLYGAGWSHAPNTLYNEKLFVGQLTELLFKLNITRNIHLVGVSMGGAIACGFAAHFPEKLKSLTLLAPAGLPFELPLVTYIAHVPILSDLLYPYIAPDTMLKRIPDGFADPENHQPAIARITKNLHYSLARNPGFLPAALAALRDFPLTQLTHYYEEVGKHEYPVQLLWGKQDRTIPFENSKLVQQLVPRANLTAYDNLGHAIAASMPHEVSGKINDLVTKIEKGMSQKK